MGVYILGNNNSYNDYSDTIKIFSARLPSLLGHLYLNNGDTIYFSNSKEQAYYVQIQKPFVSTEIEGYEKNINFIQDNSNGLWGYKQVSTDNNKINILFYEIKIDNNTVRCLPIEDSIIVADTNPRAIYIDNNEKCIIDCDSNDNYRLCVFHTGSSTPSNCYYFNNIIYNKNYWKHKIIKLQNSYYVIEKYDYNNYIQIYNILEEYSITVEGPSTINDIFEYNNEIFYTNSKGLFRITDLKQGEVEQVLSSIGSISLRSVSDRLLTTNKYYFCTGSDDIVGGEIPQFDLTEENNMFMAGGSWINEGEYCVDAKNNIVHYFFSARADGDTGSGPQTFYNVFGHFIKSLDNKQILFTDLDIFNK